MRKQLAKTVTLLTLLCTAVFAQEKGSFKDTRDGKTYKTVRIGNQIWMAENLNYNAKGSKCYDNKPANCAKYGRLYDEKTLKTACPAGWHLPTGEEWDVLYSESGGSSALKSKSGWNDDTDFNDNSKISGNGEDKFGFSLLPSGTYGLQTECEREDGGCSGFGFVGNCAFLSTGRICSSKNGNGYADYAATKDYIPRLFSVRCLKDAGMDESLQIKIDKNSIFVGKEKVANIKDVSEQDSLLIGTLIKALKNKKKSTIQIQAEPILYYDILYKVAITSVVSGFTDIRLAGKHYPIKVNIPQTKWTNNKNANALNLTLGLGSDYIEIWTHGGRLPRIFFKEMWTFRCKSDNDTITHDPMIVSASNPPKCQDGTVLDAENFLESIETIQLWTSEKNSAYDELAKSLIMIHNRFIDSPDSDNITILPDDDMAFDKIINVMDRAHNAGFFKIDFRHLSDTDYLKNLMKYKNFEKDIDKILKNIDATNNAKPR